MSDLPAVNTDVLRELCNAFVQHLRKSGTRETTAATYRAVINLLLAFAARCPPEDSFTVTKVNTGQVGENATICTGRGWTVKTETTDRLHEVLANAERAENMLSSMQVSIEQAADDLAGLPKRLVRIEGRSMPAVLADAKTNLWDVFARVRLVRLELASIKAMIREAENILNGEEVHRG
jgi:hypothetical protein